MRRAGDSQGEGGLAPSFHTVSATSVVPVLSDPCPGPSLAQMLHALFLIPGQPDCTAKCVLETDPTSCPQGSVWRCWQTGMYKGRELAAHSGWQHMLCFQQHTKCWPWDQIPPEPHLHVISYFLCREKYLPLPCALVAVPEGHPCLTAPWTKGS